MRIYTTAALMIAFLFSSGFAQGWEKAADVSVALNQSSYSNSWDGSESGTITWTFNGNFLASKTLKPDVIWRNELKLQFGQTHQQAVDSQGDRVWNSPEISSDRIYLESLFKLSRPQFADPFFSLTFDSRFYDNSVPELPQYVNPMVLTEALGLGKTLLKSEGTECLTRLGFALRQRFDNQVITIDPEEKDLVTTTYGGLEWVSDYSHTFDERMKYVSKLRVFQALFSSEADDLEGLPNADYWKATDVAWENTLSADFTKFLQISLFFEVLYDKEVDLRGRFRELMGIGIAYRLF